MRIICVDNAYSGYNDLPQGELAPDEFELQIARNSLVQLFHGTPVPPEQMGSFIKPNLTIMMTPSGKREPHGDKPVVSTSDTLRFPILKSLINAAHPTIVQRRSEGEVFNISISRQPDAAGTPHLFVGGDVLRALLTSAARGYIYGVTPANSAKPFESRRDLAEWRINEKVRWNWAAQVSMADLPDNPLVLEAPDAISWIHDTVANSVYDPQQFDHPPGISVTSLGEWKQNNLMTTDVNRYQ